MFNVSSVRLIKSVASITIASCVLNWAKFEHHRRKLGSLGQATLNNFAPVDARVRVICNELYLIRGEYGRLPASCMTFAANENYFVKKWGEIHGSA